MSDIPSDSTQVEGVPSVPVTRAVGPTDPRKPASEIRRMSPAPANPAPVRPASFPAKVADPRRPGFIASPTPPRPIPAAPTAEPAAGHDEDDPESLLREYAERQKTKIVRLEQQLTDIRKVAAERDGLKARVGDLERELAEAKKQVEVASKADEVIKDLQGKIDAAILSNGMLTEEKERLKKGLSDQTANFRRADERASHAEKSLAEVQKALSRETEARKEAEGKVAAALYALQGDGALKPLPAQAEAGGRLADRHSAIHAGADKPSSADHASAMAGRPSPAPPTAKPPGVPVKK